MIMIPANDAKTILSLIDLTTLNPNDTDEIITNLCHKAITPFGNVAAVCINPEFVKLAATLLKDTDVDIATVVNFPVPDLEIAQVEEMTKKALADGATEIDLVMPRKEFLLGDEKEAKAMITAIRRLCQKAKLKVILESGSLENKENIYQAALLAINCGADFVKTSTGKIGIGATIEAADAMLHAILDSKKAVGFKASGGIRSTLQALEYINLARSILGESFITKKTFRFGASSLLSDVLSHLKN